MTDDKKRKAEEAAADKQQLQERILRGVRGVRPDTSEATGKWVVDLKSGSTGEIEVPLQFDEKTAGKHPDDMRSWVDKMFDEFQRYLSEYNKYQSHSDMLLNSERPEFVKASNTSSTKYRTTKEIPTYFQGKLYSHKWALLVRGEEMLVKAWVLPVDFLIGFDTKDADFKPYFTMKAARNDRGLYIWHVDAVPISFEAINAISKSLFTAVVRATRDEFKEGEQFRLAAEEVQEHSKMDTEQFIQRYTIPPGSLNAQLLHQQVAAQSQQPPVNQQPAFPGYSTPMMSGQMPHLPPTPYQPPSFQQPPPFQAPVFGQPQQPPSAPTPTPIPAAPVTPPMPPVAPPMPPVAPPMPPAAPLMPPAAPPAPPPLPPMTPPSPPTLPPAPPTPQPPAPPAAAPAGPSDMLFHQALDENYKAISQVAQTASHAMTNQLELLTKIGMAAMQAQNMDGVTQVMNRSRAVKLIRDKIDEFIEELNSIKSSK